MLDVDKIRLQFPIYQKHPSLDYLDSGATSLKPQCVLDKMNEYYINYGVNIHRGVYELSYKATEQYDQARRNVARFINASFEEIVYTRNVSEALNKIALMLSSSLKEGDEIITSQLEHHSSVLPWQVISKKKGLKLQYIPLNKEGRIEVENFLKVLTNKTKVIALTLVSNVMGYLTPISEIIKIAHERNIIVIVDAAQAVPHMKIDVKEMDCDFLAFSAHKMLGPTGVGVLYGKKELLRSLEPIEYGGDMNESVDLYSVDVKDTPFKFETGTPAIAEIIGLGRAVEYLEEIGMENIANHEKELLNYAYELLKDVSKITIYNHDSDVGIINFNVDGVHPHDAATFFDEKNICLRAGHHCAQLVSRWLNVNGTLRASFYIYNDKEDIKRFVDTIKEVVDFFEKFN